jgi:hypothetical protein
MEQREKTHDLTSAPLPSWSSSRPRACHSSCLVSEPVLSGVEGWLGLSFSHQLLH